MIEVECTARRIGNSIGVTFPKDIVEKANLRENEKVKLLIDSGKDEVLKLHFGILKDKFNTEKMLKETDFELWGLKK
jgi:antitoxin component of MazEF toxin-antitoxin module